MKEIIYLDTDIMNSMLAQLDEGLINSFSLEQSNQETESEGQQSSRGKRAGINGQLNVDTGLFPGGGIKLGANLGNDGNESTNTSRTILEGQKDILNKAFHDHALEILLKKLTESRLLKYSDIDNEGDLFLLDSPYKFYDFSLIKNILDVKTISKFMTSGVTEEELKEANRITKKQNPTVSERQKLIWAKQVIEQDKHNQTSIKGLELMESLSGYFSKSFNDHILIKAENNLGFAKRKYLRETTESLSLRPDQSRSVKILARMIGKKEKVSDENSLSSFNPSDLDTIPTYFFDVMLGSFGIIKKGDILMTPIAIYYE